jgi:hypothetical protein
MIFYAQILKPELKLKPVNSSDLDELMRLKQNTDYKFEVVHPRNYQFHKKFFALLNLGFANQDKYKDFTEYRTIKTMQAGFFKMIITEKGKVFIPESISFNSMDELDFEKVYKTVLELICAETQLTSKEIETELLNFM